MTDPALTAEGQRVAQTLVTWFKRDRPAVIYVSSTKRAQQTAAPLARHLGVTPKIYNPADTAALIAAVSLETRTVLIVGHSNTVPDIIARLGGPEPADRTRLFRARNPGSWFSLSRRCLGIFSGTDRSRAYSGSRTWL